MFYLLVGLQLFVIGRLCCYPLVGLQLFLVCCYPLVGLTRCASDLARSDTPSITCDVARLSCSDPHIIITPLRPLATLRVCRSRETARHLQELHAEFNFTHLKLAVT